MRAHGRVRQHHREDVQLAAVELLNGGSGRAAITDVEHGVAAAQPQPSVEEARPTVAASACHASSALDEAQRNDYETELARSRQLILRLEASCREREERNAALVATQARLREQLAQQRMQLLVSQRRERSLHEQARNTAQETADLCVEPPRTGPHRTMP